MGRCPHENARPSTRVADWDFCPDCRSFVRKKETTDE